MRVCARASGQRRSDGSRKCYMGGKGVARGLSRVAMLDILSEIPENPLEMHGGNQISTNTPSLLKNIDCIIIIFS